ncbi:MAG: 3-oxoadipate enol-lactonase [Burkholderiaceae bacterium]|nr:3-oxoadipate enol-lactonase [Burkholderiaceae bacterium]
MPIAHINGTDIFYVTQGNPSHPAIVFSNSLGTDHSMWQAQSDALSNEFYVIRYDTRGHGKSASPAGPYLSAQLGQDVIALLDFLHIKRAHFCGLSMGGVTGQWLGINAGDRINRLVLANTAAKVGNSDAWFSRAAAVRADGLQTIADTAASRWFSPAFIEKQANAVIALTSHLAGENAEGYASCCEALADADLRDQISAISNTTLIITGEYDPVTTVADAAFMREKIRHSHTVALAASHISNIEAEQAFTRELLSFLHHS